MMRTFFQLLATHTIVLGLLYFVIVTAARRLRKQPPQYVFPFKLIFSLDDLYVIPLFLKSGSITDPTFVFILKENAPLSQQHELCMNGMDRHRLFNIRLGLLGIFTCISFLKCRNFLAMALTTVFSNHYMTKGKLPTRVRRKVRHYYTFFRRSLVDTLV